MMLRVRLTRGSRWRTATVQDTLLWNAAVVEQCVRDCVLYNSSVPPAELYRVLCLQVLRAMQTPLWCDGVLYDPKTSALQLEGALAIKCKLQHQLQVSQPLGCQYRFFTH